MPQKQRDGLIPEWLQTKATEATKQADLFFPEWEELFRAAPNEILRSALFTARSKKAPRQDMEDAEVAVIGTGKIIYTGNELRQDDEIVWLQLIHLAKERPAGGPIEFTPYSFCKAINWPIDGRSYARLSTCIKRLHRASVSIYSERLQEGISIIMIPEFGWAAEQGTRVKKYRVTVAEKLVRLFGATYYSRIHWHQRLSLPVGIATKLHGYFSTHRTPYPVKVETLMTLCGVETSQRKFKENLKDALDALVKVGFLARWSIQNNLVLVERT